MNPNRTPGSRTEAPLAPVSGPVPPRRVADADAGFTLVEIMVVIVILGLLATLVVPNVIGMSDEAKVQKAQTDCKSIHEQATWYRTKNGRNPSMEDLTTPDDKGHAFIESDITDPWDNEYIIRDIENGKFEVISWGPDGTEGTEDDITSQSKKRQ
ncbi:MAG: type II secretion system protein GspG [Planctomycetota bacterium]